MLKPKVQDRDGRERTTVAFTPQVKDLLRELARREHRSQTAELSHLVVERARAMGLDTPGHVREKVRN